MTVVSEALLAIGIIMVSMAFVLVGGNIISFQTEGLFQSTQNRIPAQISKLVREMPSASGTYSTTFQPSIESYTLQIQSNRTITAEVPDAGRSSTTFLDYRMENTVIRNAEEVCITKKSDNVSITSGSCETGNLNNFCADGRCINNICQPDRGETCANSGGDCTCNTQCQPDYEAGTYMNPIQGAGDSMEDTDQKECVLPRFVDAQDNPGDKCEYDFECGTDSGQDLQCNSATGSSGLSDTYCCPQGKNWNGIKCKDTNVLEIAAVPISFPASELDDSISGYSSYTDMISSMSQAYGANTPFKQCSAPGNHYEIKPIRKSNVQNIAACDIDCQIGAPNTGADLNQCGQKMKDCADQALGIGEYNRVHGFCKGFNCGGFGGIAFRPGDTAVTHTGQNDIDATFLHEDGHNNNLAHIDNSLSSTYSVCTDPDQTCTAGNAADCNEPKPQRKKFYMTYCSNEQRFGPNGFQHMKQNPLKTYLGASC
jgi:hypothetical protein